MHAGGKTETVRNKREKNNVKVSDPNLLQVKWLQEVRA